MTKTSQWLKSAKDDQEMFVSAFSSRPILRIKYTKTQKSGILTFTDAISRFGKRLHLGGLDEAYRWAGKAFSRSNGAKLCCFHGWQKGSGFDLNPTKWPKRNVKKASDWNKGPRVERGGLGRGRGKGTYTFRGDGKAGRSTQSTPLI